MTRKRLIAMGRVRDASGSTFGSLNELRVACCLECPFFITTIVSALAGGDGDCNYPPRSMPIEAGLARAVPRWCPLRLAPSVVMLDPEVPR